MNVFEQAPYYPGHSLLLVPTIQPIDFPTAYSIVDYPIMNPSILKWNSSLSQPSQSVIEMMTLPSNPSGIIRPRIYSNACHIYDLVYYWPHLTNEVNQTLDEDIMIFSLSKLTGHASLRFGWALVKDRETAVSMWNYILRHNLWVSSAARRRAIVLLNTIYSDGDYFFSSVSSLMKTRWNRILELFYGGQNRFSLVGEPYTAYLYLHMLIPDERAADVANAIFNAVGIIGQPGSTFGDPSGTFRISLTLHTHIFEMLLTRLRLLMYPPPPPSPPFFPKQDGMNGKIP